MLPVQSECTVDRLDNNLATVDGGEQASLLAAFLNPQMYIASGANQSEVLANLVRGLSLDVGNAIDEFIVQDLRSNLLGVPLDLAVLTIARGRDTGIPSLNETRQQLHDAGVSILTPYTSWLNFEDNINNKLSSVNFMAAYGTHEAFAFMQDNPSLAGFPADYIMDPAVIAQNDNMAPISALGSTIAVGWIFVILRG